MARARKTSPTPASKSPGLEEVVEELTVEVQKLTDQVEILRIAIDDLRCEVEYGIRNLARNTWVPTQNPTSIPPDVHANDSEQSKLAAKAENAHVDAVPSGPPASTTAHQAGLWD